MSGLGQNQLTSESPLEIIFQLLEKKNLDFSTVNLVQITNDFLDYIQRGQIEPLAIGDYLEALSKLLLLKLNYILKIVGPEPEIKINLERFGYIRQARRKLAKLWQRGPIILTSGKLTENLIFIPPKLTLSDLRATAQALLSQPIAEEKELVLKKKIHLNNALKILDEVVAREKEFVLQDKFKDKDFLVVIFLASLILYREQAISMEQGAIFDKITIKARRPDARI